MPPPPARGRHRAWIKDKVAELKANPGEWEIVRTVKSHDAASSLRRRFQEQGATATARLREDGRVDVWAVVE